MVEDKEAIAEVGLIGLVIGCGRGLFRGDGGEAVLAAHKTEGLVCHIVCHGEEGRNLRVARHNATALKDDINGQAYRGCSTRGVGIAKVEEGIASTLVELEVTLAEDNIRGGDKVTAEIVADHEGGICNVDDVYVLKDVGRIHRILTVGVRVRAD